MNQFLENFLRDAPRHVQAVRRDLRDLRRADEEPGKKQIIRRIFQTTHTLKGSAAAFELETVSGIAHTLEDLLHKLEFDEIALDDAALDALEAGFDEIENALAQAVDSPVPSAEFLLKLGAVRQTAQGESDAPTRPLLPAEFLERLNELEQKRLAQAAKHGANIFVAEIAFAFLEFNQKLVELRAKLEESGEIITTLPGVKNTAQKLALRLVFAGEIGADELQNLIENCDGEILFAGDTAEFTFADTCATAILSGSKAASQAGKEIVFEIAGEAVRFSQKQSNALSAALLHLVRNAVAHGIETPAERLEKGKNAAGKITLKSAEQGDGIRVSVTDDGRGIDFGKVADKAFERLGVQIESTEQLHQVIFTPGFSTAAELTQVSGRGIGLDAVKTELAAIGGNIEVISENGAGTTFEIILP